MALSRDKQIIVGVVVLGALGGLVYRQSVKDQALGTAQVAPTDLPSISVPDDVDKISIANGDKGEVVLQKNGDKWALIKPVEAPANQQNVKSLIDNLKELKVKEVIAPGADDALKKQYELDPSHAVHVVVFKGGEKKVGTYFGKSGSRGELAMVEGRPAVYALGGYSSYLYNREVRGWRDTEIFKFDDANVAQLTIDTRAGLLSFTRADKWAGTFKGQPIDRFDEDKVRDALRAFHALSADDFGDGKSPAETGLDAPEATVTITLKDNAGKHVLRVGKVATGSSRFAKKEGNDTTYIIGSWAADWATAGPSKFQRPLDAGVKDAAASAAAKPGRGSGELPPGHPDVH